MIMDKTEKTKLDAASQRQCQTESKGPENIPFKPLGPECCIIQNLVLVPGSRERTSKPSGFPQ